MVIYTFFVVNALTMLFGYYNRGNMNYIFIVYDNIN